MKERVLVTIGDCIDFVGELVDKVVCYRCRGLCLRYRVKDDEHRLFCSHKCRDEQHGIDVEVALTSAAFDEDVESTFSSRETGGRGSEAFQEAARVVREQVLRRASHHARR